MEGTALREQSGRDSMEGTECKGQHGGNRVEGTAWREQSGRDSVEGTEWKGHRGTE